MGFPKKGRRAFRAVCRDHEVAIAGTDAGKLRAVACNHFRTTIDRDVRWPEVKLARWPDLDSWAVADTTDRPHTLDEIREAGHQVPPAQNPDVPVHQPQGEDSGT